MTSRKAEAAEDGDDVAAKGMTLRAKFSLVVILSSCLLVAGAGLLFLRMGVAQIDEEIDKRGAAVATTLSSLGSAHWNQLLASGKAQKELEAYTHQPATEHEVFDVVLLSADAKAIKAAKASGSFRFEGGGRAIPYAADGRIVITRDRRMVEGAASTPIRLFQMPVAANSKETEVKAPEGTYPAVAAILVMLNAEPIEDAKASLRNGVLTSAAVSILIGIGIAFALAYQVTSPLRLLMQDIRAVSHGNLDHKTRPHSSDEIGVLAETFNHLTVMMKAARESEMERQAFEHDLELARQIQSNLLPKKIPKIRGMDFHAFYRAAKEVGGDYYDLVPITSQHLGLAVGDVSGKGVQGSLVMAMTRAVLRSVAPGQPSAMKAMIRVNHVLAKDLKPGSFVTLCYLVVDVVGRTVSIARAGHNPVLVYHQETRKCQQVNPPGIALGFDPGPLFEKVMKEVTLPLQRGDVIVTYTDGVVESMNEARDQYGMEKFQAYVQANAAKPAEQIVQGLVAELDRHQGSAPQHDDITILVMKVL